MNAIGDLHGKRDDILKVGMTIRAKYEDGVFKPLEDVAINAGTVVDVYVPTSSGALKGKPQSVRGFAFFGLWKDRSDIADSVEYINKLRADFRG